MQEQCFLLTAELCIQLMYPPLCLSPDTGGVPSLIAGLSVGVLAGYGAYRVSNDKRDVKVSLFTAFLLATIMGVRFKRSKKIMPAGLVAGVSLVMILRLVLLLL
ncbi:transmembrane protein 14A [Microtus ochrogaster]|uniref:Transmembrane protein 14A n=1 Tax=Microtus ochrogaster TaxID=79684 RepID=A0ABM0LT24_MICOH|nr:transmembrane protein 14A [Microtus ochrogaster]